MCPERLVIVVNRKIDYNHVMSFKGTYKGRVRVPEHRILVIEDNRDNMILIVDILTSMEYDVVQAVDAEQGIQIALREQPHLILLDLSLPRMDGWTAAKALKAEPILQPIPVIALTAHAMVGDRERALKAGCDDYITKPINIQELDRKLKKHLS
jgi:CheY-like chemotaxis protein